MDPSQILIQYIWNGTQEYAYLTNSQWNKLLLQGPHFHTHCWGAIKIFHYYQWNQWGACQLDFQEKRFWFVTFTYFQANHVMSRNMKLGRNVHVSWCEPATELRWKWPLCYKMLDCIMIVYDQLYYQLGEHKSSLFFFFLCDSFYWITFQ